VFVELADDHLEVLAGDLSKSKRVLSQRDWSPISEVVDTVTHPAALVNHVLPYGQLFGPNVFGTAEVLRLAMTTRLKPLTYVSTLAAAIGSDGALLDEDVDIRAASPSLDLNDSYANGYAVGKWAGEVLCREAYAWCGLPVSVFRCNMILMHSRYATAQRPRHLCPSPTERPADRHRSGIVLPRWRTASPL
jgi:fatty acid CoA ligase FadD9